jgi:hypothetical protein
MMLPIGPRKQPAARACGRASHACGRAILLTAEEFGQRWLRDTDRVRGQHPPQMPFAKDQDVIQAVAPKRPDQSRIKAVTITRYCAVQPPSIRIALPVILWDIGS